MKTIIISLLLLPLALLAQNRPLAVLELPVSAESFGLGGCRLGAQNNAFIYNNPAEAFTEGGRSIQAEYSALWMDQPQVTDMLLHTITTSYRRNNHLWMGGIRYYQQGKMEHIIDENMQWVEDTRRFWSGMVDVGYAYLWNHLTIYGSGGLAAQEVDGRMSAWRISLGANYTGQISRLRYTAGAAIRDLGQYKYKDTHRALSPLAHAGGSLSWMISEAHALSVYLDGGAYLPLTTRWSGYGDSAADTWGDTTTSSTWHVGGSYRFLNRYSIMAGSHWGDHDDYTTCGFSCALPYVTIGASFCQRHQSPQPHSYMLTLTF